MEVLPSPFTSQATISRTLDILKGIGQAPIVVKKEINGFVINRLQYALIMEAWRLVEVRIKITCDNCVFIIFAYRMVLYHQKMQISRFHKV